MPRTKWIHCKKCSFKARKNWEIAQHSRVEHPKPKQLVGEIPEKIEGNSIESSSVYTSPKAKTLSYLQERARYFESSIDAYIEGYLEGVIDGKQSIKQKE